jgi:hypothetical protein
MGQTPTSSHRPGAEAEGDFGEIVIRLAGELVSRSLFCLRMSFSSKAAHPSQSWLCSVDDGDALAVDQD